MISFITRLIGAKEKAPVRKDTLPLSLISYYKFREVKRLSVELNGNLSNVGANYESY
jgi:hypothetical protein